MKKTPDINPYRNMGTAIGSDLFPERKTEIVRIFSRIGASRPQSVSVIGEPGIGKTRMIQTLLNADIQKCHLELHDNIFLIAKKISAGFGESPEEFIDSMSQSVSQVTGVAHDGCGYEGFEKLVRNPEMSSFKLVFCMDDFQLVTENPDYPPEFFSFLRSMANSHNVAYVTTSPLELQRLCVSNAVEESPFFNIFTNITLKPLSPEDARMMIVSPSATAGRPLGPYADRIIGWAGAWPCDLGKACEMLFDRIGNSDCLADTEWNEFENDFLKERETIFQKRWEALRPQLREIYILKIAGEKIDRSDEYLLNELERRGYVGKEADGHPVLSNAFARYAALKSGTKITDAGQKEGLLEKIFKRFGQTRQRRGMRYENES